MTASTSASAVLIYRGDTELVSGDPVSRALPAGNYTLIVSGADKGAKATIGISRTAAPTRLQADVWGGGAIHLNWDDNSNDEVQYRVDRWTKLGWRRSVRVGADATAAVIDHLVPGATTTYRVSAVTVSGVSVRSANIVSATTQPQDTTGWYQVKLSAGQTGEAGWTLAKDPMKVLPNFRDDNNKMQSQWVYASSWQTAVWTVVASWNDNTSTYDPVSIRTSETTSDGQPVYETHNFPSGGDFKIGTADQIKSDTGVSGCDLSGGSTKYIALEDSYGSIDRDYDDFFWKVDVTGIKAPKVVIQGTTFIKQNYLAHPNPLSSTIFQGDNREGSGGAAIFDPDNSQYRTRQAISLYPMDIYYNDSAASARNDSTYTPTTGISNAYDGPSSLVNGKISAAAEADTQLNDNYLKIDTGHAATSGMTANLEERQTHQLFIKLETSAANPLVTGAPDIDYSATIILDYTDPLHPKYELYGTHDGFPCYEIDIDGHPIYTFDSGTNTPWSLFGTSDTTIPDKQGNLQTPQQIND